MQDFRHGPQEQCSQWVDLYRDHHLDGLAEFVSPVRIRRPPPAPRRWRSTYRDDGDFDWLVRAREQAARAYADRVEAVEFALMLSRPGTTAVSLLDDGNHDFADDWVPPLECRHCADPCVLLADIYWIKEQLMSVWAYKSSLPDAGFDIDEATEQLISLDECRKESAGNFAYCMQDLPAQLRGLEIFFIRVSGVIRDFLRQVSDGLIWNEAVIETVTLFIASSALKNERRCPDVDVVRERVSALLAHGDVPAVEDICSSISSLVGARHGQTCTLGG